MRLVIPAFFFLFLPFTSVFSINEQISLSIVVTVLLAGLLVLRNSLTAIPTVSFTQRRFAYFLIFAALSMVIVVLISTLSADAISDGNRVGHVVSRLSYGVLIICLLLIGVATSKCSEFELRSIIFFSYFVVLVFCLIDFAQLYGFTNYLLPRVAVETQEATFRENFLRVRGTTEEPGHLAAFFAATLPLIVQSARHPYLQLSIISALVFAFTFSTAFVIWLFVFIIISVIANMLLTKGVTRNYNQMFIQITKLLALLGCVIGLFVLTAVYLGVIDKFESTSYTGRSESLVLLNSYADHPLNLFFGFGPGAYKSFGVAQPINFFASTFVELGLFGTTIIIVLVIASLRYLLKERLVFLSSGLIAFLIFYNSIGNYWYPFFSLPIFYVLFINHSKLKK